VSKPPVIGRQLDRCDICGKKVHKINLVRTNVEFLSPEGQNYFPHSSYSSDEWDIWYGSDAGTVSIGPYADRARVSISDDNTATEISGSQTFTVQAGVSSYDGYLRLRTTNWGGQDLSSWNSLVFSFDYGFYQQEEHPEASVKVWLYDETNDVEKPLEISRTSGGRRVSAYFDLSTAGADFDASSVYFHIIFITYSGGEKIWIDRIQLEKDVTTMGTFIPTSGSAIDQSESRSMTMRKVCKSCYEPLLSKTNQYNREAEQRTDEPISVWMQSV
jgi:hypothetical protein